MLFRSAPTTFKQKREGKNEYMEGSALRIEYDGRMDKVQLYTKAWVKRGEDIVYGDYISYDANAEYAEVVGGAKSENGGTSSGRVKAIIQPKNKAGQPPMPIPESPKANPESSKPGTPAPGKSSSQLSTSQKTASLDVNTTTHNDWLTLGNTLDMQSK